MLAQKDSLKIVKSFSGKGCCSNRNSPCPKRRGTDTRTRTGRVS
jgi:hypothetical protein